MKYGTLYAYWTREWNADYCFYVQKVKSLGFDVLEISAGDLLKMSDNQLAELDAAAKDLNLAISSNLGPPPDKNISSSSLEIREAGIAFLNNIIRQMSKIHSYHLVGALYNSWPYDFVDLDKDAIWSRAVEGMKRVAETACQEGVFLHLEVLNRFETNLLNVCTEGIQFCKDVDSKNVDLLLDTFHMNIEEDNIPQAFREAGKQGLLGHVHVGEGNRRLPGQGHLPWAEIGQALRDINYNGMVVMEPFVQCGGQVGKDIKVWRDLSENASSEEMDRQIAESLKFLHAQFDKTH